MNTRSSRKQVTFSHAFTLSGYSDVLPAGKYDVLVEEELLQGLSFEAYRRTSTCMMVGGKGKEAGRVEMRPVTEEDLEAALSRDLAFSIDAQPRGAAQSPQENLK
ncbi:hypothetical protein [Paenirhodobacter populi]|uniref:Uncharacterized protein n=1 Tax=Paenirhodobacter populi TaxID=2306993 RepID=A0A443JRD8_9RHOB|nr:hypothetical protein [Sinirhodobacter populi]RWR23066.1 hypothetical protein D2T30_05435 [Sinirhodobacter populi]